jgi:3-oxoacyl-[acyl-carrier-protein] synthase II
MTNNTAKRRVVITGMGTICSIGSNLTEFWENCLKGHSSVKPIPEKWHQYADYKSLFWSPLPEIDFSDCDLTPREIANKDTSTNLLLGAVMQALESAKLHYEITNKKHNRYSIAHIKSDRMGVFIGTGVGGVNSLFKAHSYHLLSNNKKQLHKLHNHLHGKIHDDQSALLHTVKNSMVIPNRFNPFTVPMIMPNATSANVGIKLGVSGPTNTYTSSCASGTVAVGNAFRNIKDGYVDMAFSGGTEYLYDTHGSIFKGFDLLNTLTIGDIPAKLNCPFDEKRNGFLFSEGGAAVLLLEELQHAINRDAPIYGEILNFAESTDAANITAMRSRGKVIKHMLNDCLDGADLGADDIDYINAHGTGTILNDEVETKIIEEMFGKKVLINSTKSLVGHTLGASGAIEAVVTTLSVYNRKTHKCLNLKNPIRDLNFVRKAKSYPIKTAISQSFGFGGHNAVLLFQKYT